MILAITPLPRSLGRIVFCAMLIISGSRLTAPAQQVEEPATQPAPAASAPLSPPQPQQWQEPAPVYSPQQPEKRSDAELRLMEQIEALQSLTMRQPENERASGELADLLHDLARIRNAAKSHQQALETLKEELKLRTQLYKTNRQSPMRCVAAGDCQLAIAATQQSLNDKEAAAAAQDGAAEYFARAVRYDTADTDSLVKLCGCYKAVRDYQVSRGDKPATWDVNYSGMLALDKLVKIRPDSPDHLYDLYQCHMWICEQRLKSIPTSEALVSSISAESLARRLVKLKPEDAGYQLLLAKALVRVSALRRLTNDHQQSAEASAEASAIFEKSAKKDPDSDNSATRKTLYSLNWAQAQSLQKSEQFAEAEKVYIPLLDAHLKALEKAPADAELMKTSADIHYALSVTQKSLKKPDPSRKNLLACIDLRKKLLETEPDKISLKTDLALAWHDYGILQQESDDVVHAEEAFNTAITLYDAILAANTRGAPILCHKGNCYFFLAKIYTKQDKLKEAVEFYLTAAATFKEAADLKPSTLHCRKMQGTSLINLAVLSRKANKHDAAEKYYRDAIPALQEVHMGDTSDMDARKEVAFAWFWLGAAQKQQGKFAEARDTYEAAAKLLNAIVKLQPKVLPHYFNLGHCYHNAGLVYEALKEHKAAEQSFLSARDTREFLVVKQPENEEYRVLLSHTFEKLGDIRRNLSDTRAAADTYIQALGILQKLESEGKLLEDEKERYKTLRDRVNQSYGAPAP
ncbi:MAG TPA: tetratricopeptide repeat protein [Candidatus Methylacidiphilales bacterium]|nr:tetratricopeptide repeat protein [Candidatus Methylacidiphilales bacterium]